MFEPKEHMQENLKKKKKRKAWTKVLDLKCLFLQPNCPHNGIFSKIKFLMNQTVRSPNRY